MCLICVPIYKLRTGIPKILIILVALIKSVIQYFTKEIDHAECHALILNFECACAELFSCFIAVGLIFYNLKCIISFSFLINLVLSPS